MRAFADENVAAVFAAYPDPLRARLLELRKLIFVTADEIKETGGLIETLKWQQPAYLPAKPKIGSTLRLDAVKNQPAAYALFVHCQTTLIDDFKQHYGNQFTYLGKRGLVFQLGQALPHEALKHGIAMALTYHLRKAGGS